MERRDAPLFSLRKCTSRLVTPSLYANQLRAYSRESEAGTSTYSCLGEG